MKKWGLGVWVALGVGISVGAQEPSKAPESPHRTVQAARALAAPEIDGRLDDAAWAGASPTGEFVQRYPKPDTAPAFPTQVRILYDDDNLYVGVKCFDPEPAKIVTKLSRRDRWMPVDRIEIQIDSQLNRKEAYLFSLSAAGARRDAFVYNEFNENSNWDSDWEGKSVILPDGWSAEFRIPFSEIRFTRQEALTFGFQANRVVERFQEMDQWQAIPSDSNRRVSAFGDIQGLTGLSPGKSWKLVPYVAAKARTHTREPYLERGGSADAGLDFRYGLGTNFALTGTLNPDFGQVETDSVVLNLSTYETFYPEKRPFFLEGFQIFTPPGNGATFLHTRRIGAAPRSPWAPEGAEILSAPEQTTILGAAKLTGTTASGLTVGAFAAVTQKESAEIRMGDGTVQRQVLAPQTLYSALRVNQSFGTNSSVGLLVTDVDRHAGRDALVTALTWDLKFRKNREQITGRVARSSWRNGGAGQDGYGGDLILSHKPADRWKLTAALSAYDPHFTLNDMGYLQRGNLKSGTFSARYQVSEPGKRFTDWQVVSNVWFSENFQGVRLGRGGSANFYGTLKNYWGVWAGANYELSAYDDRETRGGPLFYEEPHAYGWVGFFTDDRNKVRWDTGVDVWGTAHGTGVSAYVNADIHLGDRISLEPSLVYSRSEGSFRWVGRQDSGAGERPVFADLSLRQVDVSLRASYIFTPEMTADFYMQLFDAAGRYSGFAEMVDPRRFTPVPFPENPDFHSLAWNCNLVYRWEFRPGSTLFVVYSRGQFADRYPQGLGDRVSGMAPRRDWATLVNGPRDEVFLVKFSYRF